MHCASCDCAGACSSSISLALQIAASSRDDARRWSFWVLHVCTNVQDVVENKEFTRMPQFAYNKKREDDVWRCKLQVGIE